ncbi:undecaprenyl diphosphate synthase [Thermodesulfatator indicus DSM 15286]|uniref:Isoprenyl transferase n=1 Tax=Thermodesulfatator indicus (strain DSM 15286 / JCM 11887 / CIR29812) TaxID=667014 RepID=F8ADC4_THEID|nr:isoprenyl transferase [Thermodesulfatator indicus]AEH45939.1 undecaprenyl diphosphate synthase [Thermodesulfatator indicus DSM 15286]
MIQGLDPKKIPAHVAIIMDGNGRWAKARHLPRIMGHREGMKSVRAVVEAARKVGVKVLTLYAFSKENWQRPKEEVSFLMKLLSEYLQKEVDELHEKDVQIRAIGEIELLPRQVLELLDKAIKKTKNNQGLILNLALSYGGRAEIARAARLIAEACLKGDLKPQEIDEELFGRFLYTADLPDPDLLIRTSGEKRISNFLLYQCAYTEFYFTPTLWPDFREKEFIEALKDYQARERRFGKISEQVHE